MTNIYRMPQPVYSSFL